MTASSLAMAQDANNDRATRIERICSDSKAADASAREAHVTDRATERLKLTDAQKAAFKDLQDARAKARADFKTALCANKPNLSNLEGKLAFRQTVLEQRLAELKATSPKLLAFYNSLDADQKAKFDEFGERRREHRRHWHHHRHHRHHHHHKHGND